MAVNAVGIRTAVSVLWSDAIVLVFEGVFDGGRSNIDLGEVGIGSGQHHGQQCKVVLHV